ncbi:hypothetical protein [Pseudoalteromonas sp. G4]|uniref:hypothetical protein n=1 Tax=Pseudoalteromonas sp. G4 TaxID=2992761 RepID=UPI00237D94AE|nr:hypothetical protein [Pseudoalteromonas sp. G4]MDE3271425.1 hypothetical protein [Pseudoalteromonas sp. G4]
MKTVLVTLASLCLMVSPLHAKNDKHNKGNSLPPGLQKKVARTGELPPGWQKKIQVGKPIDREIYSHSKIIAPVDHKGLITVNIDGRIIRLIEATREVVKILK